MGEYAKPQLSWRRSNDWETYLVEVEEGIALQGFVLRSRNTFAI